MSNDDHTMAFEDGDDALRDPRLQRALEHAPDRDARPDPRTRDAIHKIARNMATAPAAAAPTVLPWWRRLFGSSGKPHARMPWNTAFATLLIVGFVTVLWRQEPVPDARLDGEARVAATAPPPVDPQLQKDKIAPAQAAPDAARAVPSAPVIAPQPAPAPNVRREQSAGGSQASKAAPSANVDQVRRRAEAKVDKPAATPEAAVREKAPDPFPQSPAWPSPAPSGASPVAPAATAPAPATPAPSAAPAQPDVLAESARDSAEMKSVERRGRGTENFATAPAAAAPPATVAPVVPSVESDSRHAAPAAPGYAPPSAVAAAPAAPRGAVLAGKVAVPASPSFSALDRWTQFSVSGGNYGGSRNALRARSDVEGLPALLGAVARSATDAEAALSAPVEARVELYRGRALLAVLEIAGDQVRWTAQPSGASAVGTPPAAALQALRDLLARRPPAEPRR